METADRPGYRGKSWAGRGCPEEEGQRDLPMATGTQRGQSGDRKEAGGTRSNRAKTSRDPILGNGDRPDQR